MIEDPRPADLELIGRDVAEASKQITNAIHVAKELADLVYVTYGTAVSLGINLDEAVRRVHASNMSKRNPDGTVSYRPDGKVLKPPTYQPPDMAGVVRSSEERANPEPPPPRNEPGEWVFRGYDQLGLDVWSWRAHPEPEGTQP